MVQKGLAPIAIILIIAALKSNSLGSKAYSDGGNTIDHYEVGSSYTLIANSGGSCMY